MGLERAHAEFGGQGQGLLVVGFSLYGIGGVGVGLDNAKLVQRVRLVPAFLELSGPVERLARMLPGLLPASRQTTDLAEPGDPLGSLPRARAALFADRLLGGVLNVEIHRWVKPTRHCFNVNKMLWLSRHLHF